MSREWRIEGTIRQASLGRGVIISEGFNDRRDGPERYVGDVFRATPDDLAIMLAGPKMLEALEWIASAHIPDQPSTDGGDELAWAQRWVGTIRAKARAAITQATQADEVSL